MGKSSIINSLKLEAAATEGAAVRSSALAAALRADSGSQTDLSDSYEVDTETCALSVGSAIV